MVPDAPLNKQTCVTVYNDILTGNSNKQTFVTV